MDNFTFCHINEVGENYVMRSFIIFIPSNITVTINTRRLMWARKFIVYGEMQNAN
jgi:hypothetical protein